MTTAHEKMDRMYRYQRFFYDLTRKYYLLGRDRLIDEMDIGPGVRVLEIGCGTGRNLKILAGRYPHMELFGLDASEEMLQTAAAKLGKIKTGKICLKTALADEFDFNKTFGLNGKFDLIFFSYSISMIPTWRESLANALENLRHGGSLFIVDFYDQRDLPGWFAKTLQAWLRQFHVNYPDQLVPHLEELEKSGIGSLTIKPAYKTYSFIAEFEKM